jgi:hypothetical protein
VDVLAVGFVGGRGSCGHKLVKATVEIISEGVGDTWGVYCPRGGVGDGICDTLPKVVEYLWRDVEVGVGAAEGFFVEEKDSGIVGGLKRIILKSSWDLEFRSEVI